ncbi:SDR family NAD(P)-dependent oxidoreductase [Novosphingobium sp. PY1]|uniref:SDR family NAD(P)-dependent oxidoreductase n=1 Tax=Novosphingobium sp. PY1 TaxID=1882221 RepID=UPI001A8C1A79|nr:SDR family oxidoreductase [Novosphingobium sp. PY1]GFM31050.1 glucose 1-dehydrogenase [Novosphingobium sp. PY1]
MNRFEGRIALVTGAASGIGLATCARLASEGAHVLLADRDAQKLPAALAALSGEGHESHVLDVTEEAGWLALARVIGERHGRLDVLVNNAGYGSFAPIADTSLETWRAVMAVNMESIFLSTKILMPLLAASGSGAIVNVSSIRGIIAGVNTGSYSASKGAVRMFTKVTALECAAAGNGVRANSIHPGHTTTPLTAEAYADPVIARQLLADVPMGRPGEAEEIADGIAFLASDDARYMTGSELVVDGGKSAQ